MSTTPGALLQVRRDEEGRGMGRDPAVFVNTNRKIANGWPALAVNGSPSDP